MQPGSHSQYSQHSSGPTPPNSVGVGGHPPMQMTSSIPGNTGIIAQHEAGRRTRRWYLGIQSKKDPAHVMTEVYKALLALGCEWLQLSSYRIKCKWRPNVSAKHLGQSGVMPFMMPGGEETPQAAWAQQLQMPTRRQSDMDVDMDSKDKRTGSQDGPMKVISSREGQCVEIPNISTPEYSVKICLTLYKVQQNIYLLDFQKMAGDAFSFMTLCANIITELKTLSAASRQAQQQALLAQQQAAMVVQQHAMQQGGRIPTGPS